MDPVEESSKDTFKMIKESWKNYSKKQKLQFAGIIALVLVIPILVGGIETAKLIKSRAYPATPPITPPTCIPLPECVYNPPIVNGKPVLCSPPAPPVGKSYCPRPTATPTATPRSSGTPNPTPTVCNQKIQTVSLSPGVQSGLAGTQLLYKLSVTNNNSQGCTASEFKLSTLVSTVWTGTVSNNLLNLESGKTGTVGVVFTSPANAIPTFSYPVSVIVDGPIAKTLATSGYQVLKPTPTPIPKPIICGGITGKNCPSGMICIYKGRNQPDQTGFCQPTPSPKLK